MIYLSDIIVCATYDVFNLFRLQLPYEKNLKLFQFRHSQLNLLDLDIEVLSCADCFNIFASIRP